MAQLLVLFFVFEVILVLSSATCPSNILAKGVSQSEQKEIVTKHNTLRTLISQGKVPRQPKGTNLQLLTWDKALAKEAQLIAETCIFKHKKVADGRWKWVGQNLGWAATTSVFKNKKWDSTIQSWFDEHKDFDFPSNSSGVTGHYTQVVWADTTHVGCGFVSYMKNRRNEHLYVCNYGPGGNIIGRAPYKI